MSSSLLTTLDFTLPTGVHVSAAGSSSASAAPDDRLILRAQQVLKTVQEVGFACQEKIISCVEMYNPEAGTEALYYARFGEERYFKYVDLSETIIAVRERYKAARESLGLKGIYELQTAVVEGEHVGSCGELSCLTELHAKIAGLYAKVILLEGEVRYVAGEAGNAGRDDHALVLVSDAPFDEAATPVAAEFVKTMKGLRNVVIIDPYLSKVLKATDIEKDAEFITLLKALKVSRISRNLEMGSTPDVLVEKRAKLIERAKAMGPITDAKLVYGQFCRLKRRDLTVSLLGAVFPHTTGLWRKNDKAIFFIGPKDVVLTVSERLASVGIPQTHSKVKDKEEYCLMIDIKSYFGMKRVYDTIKAMV